jgi:hypothetical protein
MRDISQFYYGSRSRHAARCADPAVGRMGCYRREQIALCKCSLKDGLDKRVVVHPRSGRRLRKVLILRQRRIGIGFDHEQFPTGGESHVHASESPDPEKTIDIARDISELTLGVARKRSCRSVRYTPLFAICLIPLGLEGSELRNVLRHVFEEDLTWRKHRQTAVSQHAHV